MPFLDGADGSDTNANEKRASGLSIELAGGCFRTKGTGEVETEEEEGEDDSRVSFPPPFILNVSGNQRSRMASSSNDSAIARRGGHGSNW